MTPMHNMLDSNAALRKLQMYMPLLRRLDERGVDYCIVGGTAVAIWQLEAEAMNIRETVDIDVMVSSAYDNGEFARDYIAAAGGKPVPGDLICDAVLGEDGVETLKAYPFDNTSFAVGDEGIDAPNVDLCRSLNGYRLEDLERERVTIGDLSVWVASIDQLIEMKKRTIELYRATPDNTSRPQDFVDLATLRALKEGTPQIDSTESGNSADRPRPSRLARLLAAARGSRESNDNEEKQ